MRFVCLVVYRVVHDGMLCGRELSGLREESDNQTENFVHVRQYVSDLLYVPICNVVVYCWGVTAVSSYYLAQCSSMHLFQQFEQLRLQYYCTVADCYPANLGQLLSVTTDRCSSYFSFSPFLRVILVQPIRPCWSNTGKEATLNRGWKW